MVIRNPERTSVTGHTLLEICKEFGGISFYRLVAMLGVPSKPNAWQWLNGNHDIGAPYGRRLAVLLLMKRKEEKDNVSSNQSFVWDKSIDWPRFWEEEEQPAPPKRSA